ncbi:MAG: metalloregulator ArsR/SmtB family transcription factor [Longimicrobiales bacterium]|nr:metalloregulator ArsR/SmtB family transcription factor [Longimicrobiales bacterium]
MNTDSPAPVSDAILVQRFQAVAEETRLAIVRRLSGGERCVCDLQAELGAAQSRLSFHLRKLKDAGLLEDRKDGRWVYYRLVPGALEEMRSVLGELAPAEGAAWSPEGGGCCR